MDVCVPPWGIGEALGTIYCIARDWQTAIAALIALVAAGIAYKGARLQARTALKTNELRIAEDGRLEEGRRQRRQLALTNTLRNFVTTLEARAGYLKSRASESAIPMPEVSVGERAPDYRLVVPDFLRSDWEAIGLLPLDLQDLLNTLLLEIEGLNQDLSIGHAPSRPKFSAVASWLERIVERSAGLKKPLDTYINSLMQTERNDG